MRVLKKIILDVGVFMGVIVLGLGLLLFPTNEHKLVNAVTDPLFGWKYPTAKFPSTGFAPNSFAYSDIRDPGGIPQGLPIRLKIPVINVDSVIEDAYITPDGRMDVPAGSVNVAWFALGPHPGQNGSAVIGGHYGIDNGIPKVFYNLKNLKIGDKIYIVNDKGETLAFVVKRTKLYNRNDDATTVFTSNDGIAHLNLITCEGIWNEVNDTYPQRLVVFTDAIPAEEPVSIKPQLTTTLKPSPSIFPTEKPVITKTELTTTLTPTPSVFPILVTKEEDTSISQKIGAYIAVLYDDPVDGVISSLLILSIIFTLILIFR